MRLGSTFTSPTSTSPHCVQGRPPAQRAPSRGRHRHARGRAAGRVHASSSGLTRQDAPDGEDAPAALAADAPPDREELQALIATLQQEHPWLYTPRAVRAMGGTQARNEYANLLHAAVPLLLGYDISSPDGRPPSLRPPPHQIIEPCLTARAAARWEAAQRAPRPTVHRVAIGPPPPHEPLPGHASPQAPGPGAQGGARAAEDDRWAARQAAHAAYGAYMLELRRALGLPAAGGAPGAGEGGGASQRRARQKRQGQPAAAAAGAADADAAAPRAGRTPSPPDQPGQLDQLDQQLQYQVGICDDWLQLDHLATVFHDALGPGTAAALLKRAASVVPMRAVAGWGPGERLAFGSFRARAAGAAGGAAAGMEAKHVGQAAYGLAVLAQLQQAADGASTPGPGGLLPAAAPFGAAAASATPLPPLPSPPTPTPVAALAGSSGAGLARPSGQLGAALDQLCARAELLLQQEQRRQQAQAQRRGGGADASGDDAAPAPGWQAVDYAQLLWGLGSLGHAPPAGLLQRACSACYLALDRFQAPQLWGVLWGLAQLSGASGYAPDKRWVARFLKACSRVMGGFDAQGLGALIWSLAALRPAPPPEKEWLRGFAGACGARLRSLQAMQLVQVVEGLAVLGYTPRNELCRALMGQMRRQMHIMSGGQLAVVLRAMATAQRWRPPRQFLYDYVVHSQPKLQALSAAQAAGIMWAFAKLGYLPEPDYMAGLALRVAVAAPPPPLGPGVEAAGTTTAASPTVAPGPSGASPPSASAAAPTPTPTAPASAAGAAAAPYFRAANGDDLSMALWALAQLGAHDALHTTLPPPLQPQPRAGQPQKQRRRPQQVAWLDAWLARAGHAAHAFTGPAAANSLWALARLSTRPPATLLDALLLRVSALLPELAPHEAVQAVAALAAMRYRPSDAWLAAAVAQCRTHLAALAGDDLGALLWSLAALGCPLDQEWLAAYSREAARAWPSHSGESLGLMAWALSQYDCSPFSHANDPAGPAPPPLPAAAGARVLALPETRYEGAVLQAPVPPPQQQQQQAPQAVLSMSRKEEAWWLGYYRACCAQWHSASPRALVLMLLGVAHLVCTAPDKEWQRGLMRAIRLRIPRPPTSDAVLPTLLAVAGLVEGSAGASPIGIGTGSSSSSSRGSDGSSSSSSSSSKDGARGTVGGAPALVLSGEPLPLGGAALLQATAGAVAHGVPQMSMAEVLAVLPPQAARSVWLAAFVAELKAQWGFPRSLSSDS